MDIPRINASIQALDLHPRIMEPALGRWCLWPVAKPVLHAMLLAGHAGAPDSGVPSSNVRRRVGQSLRHAAHALRSVGQAVSHAPLLKGPHLTVFTHAKNRRERDATGGAVDIYFDRLLASGLLAAPPLVIEDSRGWPHPASIAGQRHLYEEGLTLASSVLARRHRGRTDIAESTRTFAAIVRDSDLGLGQGAVEAGLATAFAHFAARRAIYRRFLGASGSRGLLLIDADSMLGPIAAAHECGLPVFELQHGVTGVDHIGYQWAGILRPHRERMAVPTCIFTFGTLWQDLFTRRGFWGCADVIPVGAARMEPYLARANTSQVVASRSSRRLTVIFMTQWTCRPDALAFWQVVLNMWAATGTKVHLVVKVHPRERTHIAEYALLHEMHPSLCTVLQPDENVYELMLGADIVVSYHSTTLLEALSLGVPAVSICGGPVPGGLAGATGIQELAGDVTHVRSPAEMVDLVAGNSADSAALAAWARSTRERGSRYYRPGFARNAAEAINTRIGPRASRVIATH